MQVILFQYKRCRDIKIEIQCQPLTSTLTPTHMQANKHSHVCKHVHTHDACHILKVKHGYCDALVICMIKTSDKTFKAKCDLFYSWSTWILSMTDWLQIFVKTSWYGSTSQRNFFMYVRQEERQNKSGTGCPQILARSHYSQWLAFSSEAFTSETPNMVKPAGILGSNMCSLCRVISYSNYSMIFRVPNWIYFILIQ